MDTMQYSNLFIEWIFLYMLPCLSLYALSQYYVNYENLQRSQLTNLLTKLVAVGLLVFVTLNKELLIVEPYLYLLDLPGKLSDSGEAVICALEILGMGMLFYIFVWIMKIYSKDYYYFAAARKCIIVAHAASFMLISGYLLLGDGAYVGNLLVWRALILSNLALTVMFILISSFKISIGKSGKYICYDMLLVQKAIWCTETKAFVFENDFENGSVTVKTDNNSLFMQTLTDEQRMALNILKEKKHMTPDEKYKKTMKAVIGQTAISLVIGILMILLKSAVLAGVFLFSAFMGVILLFVQYKNKKNLEKETE